MTIAPTCPRGARRSGAPSTADPQDGAHHHAAPGHAARNRAHPHHPSALPSGGDPTTSSAQQAPHLGRAPSSRHIQLIAIGGAIGAGLFMGAGRTIAVAGPSVIFVYMIIGFMLFFVMRAMGELLLSNTDYKNFSDFAGDILGPWASFFTGWTYWFCWVVTMIVTGFEPDGSLVILMAVRPWTTYSGGESPFVGMFALAGLAGVALLYAEGSVAAAFTLVTTISALCFRFVWSIILVSYLVYRRRRPQLHAASKFKTPGGTFMPYVVLAFFGLSSGR